jgi:cell division protease FtsH
MVMQYGMSRLGRVNYLESSPSAFLSLGEDRPRSHSEHTAREIDEEIRRIIEGAIEKVRQILKVRERSLQALTERLIEVESIDADELKRIIDEHSPGPVVVPGTLDAPARPATSSGKGESVEPSKGGEARG